MEKIINYKIKDFFELQDENLVGDYLMILETLNPLKKISNPDYKWYKKNPKSIEVKPVRSLTFGDVALIRNNFNSPSIETIIDAVKLVTGSKYKQILNFTIVEFYGIISYIKSELLDISNIEENELSDDYFDINAEVVNANKRMARFGVLNVIDSLTDNVAQWEKIESMSYMTVLTKMIMNNEKNKIQREIAELQKKKAS